LSPLHLLLATKEVKRDHLYNKIKQPLPAPREPENQRNIEENARTGQKDLQYSVNYCRSSVIHITENMQRETFTSLMGSNDNDNSRLSVALVSQQELCYM
jgi:hypothetical protein